MLSSSDINRRFREALYAFDGQRRYYNLTPARVGFFQPFHTTDCVHQQWKTLLVSPLIGVSSLASNCCRLLKNIALMLISLPCLSPSLFVEGAVDAGAAIVAGIASAVVACAVTLGALVSLFTRTIATIFSFDRGPFDTNFFTFLPDNPYAGNILQF